MTEIQPTVLFPFCGLGAGALGFIRASVNVAGVEASFRSLGGIDFDANACRDFEYLTGSPAWCTSVETITPADLRARYGPAAPDVVFMSPPCKGSSRLLSAEKAKTAKYQAMNRLATEWTRRMLEAWPEGPALVLLENVPGLPTRASAMLRELRAMLRKAGYVFHASTHDCGEIGGLAQHRTRYLLVARRPDVCPSLLYQPPKKRVRGVGEVLAELPMPATEASRVWGDLHTMPALSWRNWLRLALIPAGGDWRDLAGVLEGRARREVFRRHAVQQWSEPIDAVTGPGGHSVEAVADPRGVVMRERNWNGGTYGVVPFDAPIGAVAGEASPSNGRYSVADPRAAGLLTGDSWHHGALGVRPWDGPAATVTGGDHPSKGRFAVADPRYRIDITCEERPGAHGVMEWTGSSGAIVGSSKVDNRPVSVGDPRVDELRVPVAYDAGYGVLRWDEPARTVAGTAAAGTGAYAVADGRDRTWLRDVRVLTLDEAMALDIDARKPPPFVPVIIAEDGTWHRPLTLLELAALQGIPAMVDGEPLRLTGTRTQRAEHIGNAVPVGAGLAIAERMLVALAESKLGAMSLSSGSFWVVPSVAHREEVVSWNS